MLSTKTRILYLAILAVVLMTGGPTVYAEDGISIKGKISVRGYERDIWERYLEKLEITLSGDSTGETAQTVSDDDLFMFEQVNPEDVIEILWIHDESTKDTHVLFPFDQEGKASTLSNGLIRFRFRKMQWVLNEFKKRSSRAAIKGRIKDIDEIVTHAKQYHEVLSESVSVDQGKIDRYKHKLLQHICQKSEEQRRTESSEFIEQSNISIQRQWYVELLNIAGDDEYAVREPAALRRALNQWVVFSRQSYTKYNKWSDSDISLTGDIKTTSLKNVDSRDLLNKDIILISGLLEKNGYSSMEGYPFSNEGVVDMNSVGNWIEKINRKVKPRANNK